MEKTETNVKTDTHTDEPFVGEGGDEPKVFTGPSPGRGAKKSQLRKSLSNLRKPDDPNKNAHLQWDEATISLHDKDRGTRMIIDEPNTPFHYSGSPDDSEDEEGGTDGIGSVDYHPEIIVGDGGTGRRETALPEGVEPTNDATKLCMESLESKLHQWKERQEHSSSLSDDANGPSPTASFSISRSKHYNEFEMLKKFREQHKEDEEDDEDEKD